MGTLPINQNIGNDLAARLAKLGVKDISSVKTDFYPPIEPNCTGFLPVSDIHTLYWEESGNPKGQVRASWSIRDSSMLVLGFGTSCKRTCFDHRIRIL